MGFADRRGAALEDLAAAGGLDMAVRIIDYDPTWPALFEAECKRLARLLDGVGIHRVGLTATDPKAKNRRHPEVAGQLAADLQAHGLDLAQLLARINAASDAEEVVPLTDEYLQEIESIRTSLTEVLDAVTRARVRAVLRAATSPCAGPTSGSERPPD